MLIEERGMVGVERFQNHLFTYHPATPPQYVDWEGRKHYHVPVGVLRKRYCHVLGHYVYGCSHLNCNRWL